MEERDTDLSILSEVWEKKENKTHQNKIEELFEMKSKKYFSTARPGTKRGGGAAIVVNGTKFHCSKLNIEIPKPLEVVWGLLRPKVTIGSISKIIICSFYSPPNSRKKGALTQHIITTINKLRITHPKASCIIAGDKNDWNIRDILSISPAFRQIVLKPTRKNKILTVVITDIHQYFNEPVIVPPVPVDDGAIGAPSDHNGVLVVPLSNSQSEKRTKQELTVRPITDSGLNSLGQHLVLETWSFLDSGEASSSDLVQSFQDYCKNLVDNLFPLKTIFITKYDKPYFNERLRRIRRQRQRVYRKQGKSEKYLKLKTEFNDALIKEAEKYKDKIIAEVAEGKRGSAYKGLRKLGSNDDENTNFEIPSHVDKNL